MSLLDNKLVGEIPETISQLINLEELVLSNNQLSGALPFQLSQLENLSLVMLSDNNLNNEYVTIVDNNPSKSSLFLEDETIVDND